MKILHALIVAMITATTLAPIGARAQSAASRPSSEILSQSVLAKMLSFNAAEGHDGEMPAAITSALGLTAADKSWPDRQVAVVSRDTGAVHAVAASRGADKDIILSVKGPVAISVFRVRGDGTLVGAIEFFLATRLASPMTADAARAAFADETGFWAAHIDRMVSAG